MAERNHKPRARVGKSESPKPNREFPYIRHLKVHPGQYYSSGGPLYLHLSRPPKPLVPWVHVKGYWLAEAGFAIGTQLEVEVSEGRLVISAAADPANT